MVICRNCGKDNQPGYRFCQECGSPMFDGAPSLMSTTAPPVGGAAHAALNRPGGVVKARLVLVRPDGSDGGSHPLVEGVNLLGRGSGPLFDADSYLSPVHVRIEIPSTRGEGLFSVRDAGSLNGVFLKISEEEQLVSGSVFRVGQELLRLDAIRPPRLGDDGNVMIVVIDLDAKYRWGMAVDCTKAQLGILVSVVIPDTLPRLREALR